jgi:hypothetical protein
MTVRTFGVGPQTLPITEAARCRTILSGENRLFASTRPVIPLRLGYPSSRLSLQTLMRATRGKLSGQPGQRPC